MTALLQVVGAGGGCEETRTSRRAQRPRPRDLHAAVDRAHHIALPVVRPGEKAVGQRPDLDPGIVDHGTYPGTYTPRRLVVAVEVSPRAYCKRVCYCPGARPAISRPRAQPASDRQQRQHHAHVPCLSRRPDCDAEQAAPGGGTGYTHSLFRIPTILAVLTVLTRLRSTLTLLATLLRSTPTCWTWTPITCRSSSLSSVVPSQWPSSSGS